MNGCSPRLIAGAVYWVTLTTTVGYGKIKVSSHVTRILSYTLGFLSIMAFILVTSQAGTVLVAILDDFLIEKKLRRWTEGLRSCLLWFVSMWCMIFIMGLASFYLIVRRDGHSRTQDVFPLSEFIWFSYITMTTVGFGDYSLATNTNSGLLATFIILLLLGYSVIFAFTLKVHDYGLQKIPYSVNEAYVVLRRLRRLRETEEEMEIEIEIEIATQANANANANESNPYNY